MEYYIKLQKFGEEVKDIIIEHLDFSTILERVDMDTGGLEISFSEALVQEVSKIVKHYLGTRQTYETLTDLKLEIHQTIKNFFVLSGDGDIDIPVKTSCAIKFFIDSNPVDLIFKKILVSLVINGDLWREIDLGLEDKKKPYEVLVSETGNIYIKTDYNSLEFDEIVNYYKDHDYHLIFYKGTKG